MADHGFSHPVSRRTLAKGVMWTAPAVVAATAAPAFAASPLGTGTVCKIVNGAGTVNYQAHNIILGIKTDTGVILAGTTITYTLTLKNGTIGGGTNEVPTSNYSADGGWTMTYSKATGSALADGESFTVTITYNRDYTQACAPMLMWTEIYTLRPGAELTIATPGPTGPVASTGAMSLSYQVVKRGPSGVNQSGRSPHIYGTKSGTLTCWPQIEYTQVGSDRGRDDVTTYPAGTTGLLQPCTWNGRGCNADPSGLSTPSTVRNGGSSWIEPEHC